MILVVFSELYDSRILSALVKSQSPSCLYAPLKYWKATVRFPCRKPLLQAEQAQLPQPFFIGEVLPHSDHPHGFLWTPKGLCQRYCTSGLTHLSKTPWEENETALAGEPRTLCHGGTFLSCVFLETFGFVLPLN